MADLIILSNGLQDGHAGAGTGGWAGLMSGGGKNFTSTSNFGSDLTLGSTNSSIVAGANVGNTTHHIRQSFLTFNKSTISDTVTSAQIKVFVRDSQGAPKIIPMLGTFDPTLAPSANRMNAFVNHQSSKLADEQLVSTPNFTLSTTATVTFDLNSTALGVLNDPSIDNLLVMLIDSEYNFSQDQPVSGDFNLTNIYYSPQQFNPLLTSLSPQLIINYGPPRVGITLASGTITLNSGKITIL
tara:strand:- start:16484 stop:17206 length:723 start_codon:yes stop_codon:yes gene_type:complete